MTRATGITPPSYDDVMSTCWCDQSFVWVKPADVLNGRTDTCYRPDCKPPQEKP